MIRNLVLKLPSFTSSSEIRQRTFRSLSPVSKFNPNKTRTSLETHLSEKLIYRTVTYTKEHFNRSTQLEEDEEEPSKQIKWREEPQKKKSKAPKAKKIKVQESVEVEEEQPEAPQVQYYEQYELEAARPRPIKSREIIEKFRAKPTQSMFGTQLQPNELQPYGSHENVFSYNLIAPTDSKNLRKKLLKKEMPDDCIGASDKPSRRSYSTYAKPKIAEPDPQSDNTQGNIRETKNFKTNFKNLRKKKVHWGCDPPELNISPPNFRAYNEEEMSFVECSPKEAFRHRREQANKDASSYYKKSYSDLIKSKETNEDADASKLNETCVDCVNAPKNSSQLLNMKSKPSATIPTFEKRSMSTFSKAIRNKQRSDDVDNIPKHLLANTIQEQKAYYSKYDACNDPCREQKKKQKAIRRTPKMEPKDLDCKDPPKSNKVFLASKIRLPPVKCLPKFEYDCKVAVCPPRADQCLKVLPKRLPVMIPKECPCVEQPLKDAPTLRRLCFEFKDPPKEKCWEEPCTTPRADDSNPYKFKPLPSLKMGDCDCIEPPPMKDVKLKRLPPCQPQDVCWPVREPCIPEPCPPRADVCLKVTSKRLPILEPKVCPCVEPPKMTSPPLPRLCLDVPEPPRICLPPPDCPCVERADKCYKPKRKVLPKFVPGDCPCIDRPMTDVKLRRLECVDDPPCPVREPDHCIPFPRADYGCWEFSEDTCYEVDESCVEKIPDPCDPPKCKKDPCERKDICKTGGPLNYNPRRKYNTDSTSMILFNKLKRGTADVGKTFEKKNMTINAVLNAQKSKSKNEKRKSNQILKRNISLETIQLLQKLDKIDNKGSKRSIKFDANDSKKSSKKIDYDTILKNIESSSALYNKKKSSKTAVSVPLCISSRAISTSQAAPHDEKKIREAKHLAGKKKCQNLKPKTLCQARGIKGGLVCGQTKCKDIDMCKKDRVPVCCEKEEAPYAAFSDKIYDLNVNPYKDFNQCLKCVKTKWPCTPDYKPNCDKRKFFSTSTLVDELPLDVQKDGISEALNTTNSITSIPSLFGSTGIPPKATLSSPSCIQSSRSYATKIFKIKKPEIKCDDLKGTRPAKQITCIDLDDPCKTTKKSCKRLFYEKTTEKIKSPYPAFSDCLDEDMEDILSECPLERDKYTQLQPRHIPPANPIRTPLPPPPKSEPLDLSKEQYCIKARLGKFEGTTQTCKTFGNKMPLLKSRDVFKQPNKDCERVEQLKKEGRWPPLTLKQNRHLYSTYTNSVQIREFSTFLGGLNCIHEINTEIKNTNHGECRRMYIRNFHSLIKNPDKSIFTEVDSKMKEFTMKQFPDVSDSCKILKLKNKQWRKENLTKFSKLNERVNLPTRVKRFYTNYKNKNKYHLKKSARNVSSKAMSMQRRNSDPRLKFYKPEDEKEDCKKSNENCNRGNKFPPNDCPISTNKCAKKRFFIKDCSKPNTPYPAFSECGDHDMSRAVCECPLDANQLDDLQPRYCVLPVIEKRKYPTEDRVDTNLGQEYCKQKLGLQQQGLTLDCKSFPEHVAVKKTKKTCKKPKQFSQANPKKSKPAKLKTCPSDDPPDNACKEDDIYNVEIECVLAEKERTPCDPCRDLQACCSHILEKSKCEKPKPEQHVIPPCCLPEEDRSCKEYCKRIILSDNLNPEEECYRKFCKKIICYKNSDDHPKKPKKLYKDEEICKNISSDVKDFCKEVVGVKSKDVPKKVSGLSEECANKLLEDCEKIAHLAEKCLKKYEEEKNEKMSKKPPEPPKLKVVCESEIQEPPKKCPKFKAPCKETPAVQTSLVVGFWQKIVNYFKARPGCPEPGDWKKKALNDKAHKAAAAAGLVAIDPKCVPPDVLKEAKSDPCCRVCPSEQPICKPPENKNEDDACKKQNISKSSAASEKTGKFGMFKRNYSKSFSWTNLEEINKILEEDRQKKSVQRASRYLNKEFTPVNKNEEQSEQINKSLQYQLKPFPLRVSTLCRDAKVYPRSYFGYTNILPSRENVLERAWRLSIEAAKKRQGEIQAVGILNEIIRKVDNSIKSQEDLEKMKTENVLRELDRFLKLKEDSNEDNKN